MTKTCSFIHKTVRILTTVHDPEDIYQLIKPLKVRFKISLDDQGSFSHYYYEINVTKRFNNKYKISLYSKYVQYVNVFLLEAQY